MHASSSFSIDILFISYIFNELKIQQSQKSWVPHRLSHLYPNTTLGGAVDHSGTTETTKQKELLFTPDIGCDTFSEYKMTFG